MKQPTWYKNSSNLTCFLLILTNVPQSFQSKSVLETALSDFYLTAVTVMRKKLKKTSTVGKIRDPINIFQMNISVNNFLHKLSKDVKVNDDDGFERFCDINITTVNAQNESQKEVCSRFIESYKFNKFK